MKCPQCNTNMEPIGYSMFDIVYGCPDCEEEKDVPRTFENEHIVREMTNQKGT